MAPLRTDPEGLAGEREVTVPPTDREVRVGAGLFAPVGVAMCVLAIFANRWGIGAVPGEDVFGWKRAALLAVGALVVAAAALVAARPGLVSRRRAWDRVLRCLDYLPVALLLVLGLALMWTRFVHIGESLGHDAAFTAVNYIAGGPGAILLGEEAFDVNNHVAYNLLSWLTVNAFGESESTYRLWSVVPGIAAIGFGAWWGWRRLGPVTAIAFTALAVAAPLHLEHTTEARGYGLALLAATLMLIAADRLLRGYTLARFLAFLGAGLLGIWTLFIFAIAFVGQALPLLARPDLRRPVIALLATAAALSLAFYAPVLSDLIGAEVLGEPIPLAEAAVLYRALEWLAVPSFTVVTRGDPAAWMTLSALALVLFGLVRLWRRGNWGLALLLVVPPLLFNLAFGVSGMETVVRHQFLLLTHVLFMVAIGLAEAVSIVTRYRPLRPIAIVAGAVAVLLVAQAIVEREREETTPPENFKEVAEIVRWSGMGPAITDTIRHEGFTYYMGDDIRLRSPEQVESAICGGRRDVVYVRHVPSPPERWGIWEPADLSCLVGEDALRIRVPQRIRGAAIDVWIVNPRRAGATWADEG